MACAIRAFAILVLTLCFPSSGASSSNSGKDAFGILQKYPTAPNGKTWTSAHWANGKARMLTGRDSDDPTGVSETRGSQAEHYVDGNGVLQFRGKSSGSEPRLHLNGTPGTFFKNVEITFYYLRESDYDVDWGGMVVGARSSPDGHTNQPCAAHTYYARFRNDGKYDFEKELKHPASSPKNSTNIWNGSTDLPKGQWIGMKFVVLNVTADGKPAVQLELYRDLAAGANGGAWTKIGQLVDSGGWAPPQNDGACPNFPADYVPLEGGGVIVLRNTGVTQSSYKWMTVREITPPPA